jgi:hypothetical protein
VHGEAGKHLALDHSSANAPTTSDPPERSTAVLRPERETQLADELVSKGFVKLLTKW